MVMFTEYEGYRDDQKAQQTAPHYSKLRNNRDVFDTSIIFD